MRHSELVSNSVEGQPRSALGDASPSRGAGEPVPANGGAPGLGSRGSVAVSATYIESITQALPVGGQLDRGLRLSPQGLGGHKAREVKGVFPREHVIHGPRPLVRQYGECLGFAICVFQFGKVRFAGLILP